MLWKSGDESFHEVGSGGDVVVGGMNYVPWQGGRRRCFSVGSGGWLMTTERQREGEIGEVKIRI